MSDTQSDERTNVSGRPTVAYIDAAALRDNFTRLRQQLSPGVSVLAVVKADGYGHGATLVARVLAEAGADAFGVATVAEGVELREAGITQPILVLAGAMGGDVEAALACRLRIAVVDEHMARDLAAAVGGRALPVHLKLDTGMTRLGVIPDALPACLAALRALPQLDLEGVFSHFGDADSVASPYADHQQAVFAQQMEVIQAAGFRPRWTHLANSAATLTRPDTHWNLVRPGIVLYGVAPECAHGFPVRPVMHLRTRIWQLKSVPAECPVSYGQTFVTRRPSRIAILPIGYADGYDRRLSNRGEVLVREHRAPIIGRVCMDLTVVDVTDVPGVAAGDEVVLWGRQGQATLSVEEVAAWQESIPYEVLTRLGKRVPRLLQ
jgi:alanine racemase